MRTTKTIWLPLLAAAALVLTGCGGGGDDQGGDGASQTPADQGGPDGDEPGEEPDGGDGANSPDDAAFQERAMEIIKAWPAEPAPPAGIGEELQPVVAVEDAAPEDTVLTAQIGHGDCDVEWGGWVKETDDLVILGGWSVRDPETEMCNESLAIDPVELELAEPLGERQLVDAVSGAEPQPDGV